MRWFWFILHQTTVWWSSVQLPFLIPERESGNCLAKIFWSNSKSKYFTTICIHIKRLFIQISSVTIMTDDIESICDEWRDEERMAVMFWKPFSTTTLESRISGTFTNSTLFAERTSTIFLILRNSNI